MVSSLKNQSGVGLVIALLMVGFTAAVLTTFINSKSGNVLREEARVSGWEGAKIARAARIHSRNEIRARPNLKTTLDPANGTGPEEVSINSLITASLLPVNFARVDASGNYYNALGQRIRVFLANYPISDNTALPTSVAVPTAFIIFEENNSINTADEVSLVQDIVAAIRGRDVSVSAPLFNGTTNVTGACNGGGNTTALWDSGCLDTNDFTTLTGGGFAIGDFVIPAWRSVNFNSRAMMRYPQPEQIGAQTMLTHLEMAEMENCDADNDGVLDQNFITIPTDGGSNNSSLCRSLSDDPVAGVDNRRNIENVGNITNSVRLIVDSQTGDDIYIDNLGNNTVVTDETHAVDIVGGFTGSGDGYVYGNNVVVGNTLTADKNISVVNNVSGGISASSNVNQLNVGNATSNILSVANQPSLGGNINVRGNVNNVTNLSATNDLVTSILQVQSGAGGSPVVTVNNQANISQSLTPTSMTVSGTATIGNGYSFVTGDMNSTSANVGGTMDVLGSATFSGVLNAQRLDITNASTTATCLNDCPPRKRFAQCTNLQNAGLLASSGYSTFQECMNDG